MNIWDFLIDELTPISWGVPLPLLSLSRPGSPGSGRLSRGLDVDLGGLLECWSMRLTTECSIKLVRDEVRKWEGCAGLCGLRTWSLQDAYGLFGRHGELGKGKFIDRFKDSLSDKEAMGAKRVLGATKVALPRRDYLGLIFRRSLAGRGVRGTIESRNLAHSKSPTLSYPRQDYPLLCPPTASLPVLQGSPPWDWRRGPVN